MVTQIPRFPFAPMFIVCLYQVTFLVTMEFIICLPVSYEGAARGNKTVPGPCHDDKKRKKPHKHLIRRGEKKRGEERRKKWGQLNRGGEKKGRRRGCWDLYNSRKSAVCSVLC